MAQFVIREQVKRYWPDYFWGLTFLLGTNVLAANIPLKVKGIVDAIGQHNQSVAVNLWAQIAGIIVIMFVIRILSRYFLIGVGRKIEYDTRLKLFSHLLSMPKSYFDVQQTGEMMSRLTNDLTAMRMMLGGGVMLLMNVLFAYLTILPLMSMLSWRLTLFAFLLYPAIILVMRKLSGRVKQLSHEVQDNLGDLTAVAQENFSGISIIQSYAKEKHESARFYDTALGYLTQNTLLVKARAGMFILIAAVSGISILVVLGEGGREVITGGLTLSGFTAFVLYLERLSWPTVSFGWILSTIQQGRAAKERINQVLNALPVVTDEKADRQIQAIPDAPLNVRNLSFRYDNPYAPPQVEQSRDNVLTDLSFTVEPGQLVAVVGPIGSGKTTLLNLLVRFYNAPENAIFFGETPVERIPLKVLRRDVSLMPQNTFLFSTTVEENMAYLNPNIEEASIREMAQVAHIHEEIERFPMGYQTMVGERGVTLSGGQRQRSTLVRTLLLEPKILLLDDPFASVDGETEEAIISALHQRKILRHRTTIFSSQRFSFVRQADWILVLSPEGHVDSMGTHEDLLRKSALYRALNKMSEDAQDGERQPEDLLG